MNKRSNYGVPDISTDSPWYRTGIFRIVLGVLAVIAIVGIVMFSEQIGDLLSLLGLKAAPVTGSASLQGNNNTAADYFLGAGFTASEFDPATGTWIPDNNTVKVDDATDRLMIN